MRLEKSPPSAMFITCSGRKSGDDRSAPMPATRSCVCGLPGLSTITTRAEVVVGRAERGARRRAPLPRAEGLVGKRAQLRHGDVAGHHERRVVRDEALLPERLHVGARDRLHRRLGADFGEAVRMARAVDGLHRNRAHERGGVVALLHQLPEPLRTLAIDLVGRKRGAQRHVGQQVQRRREVLRRATAPTRSSNPSSCRCRATRRAARARRQSPARCAWTCPRRASRPRSWPAQACPAGSNRCRRGTRGWRPRSAPRASR